MELQRLRKELENRSTPIVDKNILQDMEKQKKRLEEEKLNAINQLEVRSQEFAKEKERLMARIKMLTSQVLVGGKHIEETPQFKSALEERQRAIRQEYE